jgi:hypothetical protein
MATNEVVRKPKSLRGAAKRANARARDLELNIRFRAKRLALAGARDRTHCRVGGLHDLSDQAAIAEAAHTIGFPSPNADVVTFHPKRRKSKGFPAGF